MIHLNIGSNLNSIHGSRHDNILIATQTAVSKDLTDFNLFITLMSYPLMGFKVILAIHWHALRLFFKGLRFYSYSEWVNNK